MNIEAIGISGVDEEVISAVDTIYEDEVEAFRRFLDTAVAGDFVFGGEVELRSTVEPVSGRFDANFRIEAAKGSPSGGGGASGAGSGGKQGGAGQPGIQPGGEPGDNRGKRRDGAKGDGSGSGGTGGNPAP